MPPIAHQQHCPVCTASPSAPANTWWLTSDFCVFFPLCFATLFLTPRYLPCLSPPPPPFTILATCRLTGLCLLTPYTSLIIHLSTTEKLTEFSSWLSSQMIDKARHADRSWRHTQLTCLTHSVDIRVINQGPCSQAEPPPPFFFSKPELSPFCSLAFGTLYPAYSSYKAVKTKNVKEYVSKTWWPPPSQFLLFDFREIWPRAAVCCANFYGDVLNAHHERQCTTEHTDRI